METVVTFDGSEAPKDKCRRIKNEYYTIGNIEIEGSGQCYLMPYNNKYVRLNSGLIIYDYEQGCYVKKEGKNYTRGIVDFKRVNSPILGDFIESPKNVWLRKYHPFHNNFRRDQDQLCISEEIAIKGGYIESYLDGYFYYGKIDGVKQMQDFYGYNNRLGKYKNFSDKLYNMENNPGEILLKKSFAEQEKKINPTPSIKLLAKLIKGYSIGIEEEVGHGFVPERFCLKHGLLPVKDGSLPRAGWEYAMIPMFGEKGLQNIQDAFMVFNKYTRPHELCSLHVHVGGASQEKLFIIAFYMLMYHLQQEFFEVLPPFKKDARFTAKKRNNLDHCKFLPSLGLQKNCIYDALEDQKQFCANIDKYYENIFKFLNGGQKPCNQFNKKSRKSVYTGRNKWEHKPRYHHVNLMPLHFNKSGTIEFRAHHATSNPTKVINWVMLCVGLIKFAERYTEEIIRNKTKFGIADVVAEYATNFGTIKATKDTTFVAEYLDAYFRERRAYFSDMKQRDSLHGDEFPKDATYSFKYKRKTLFNFV